MTKQPEALRLADVLIGSSQFTGTPIWQAADMLRRQHAEITSLRTALEQPAQEPVAWRWVYQGHPDSGKCFPMPPPDQDVQDVAKMRAYPRTVQLLYAAPQAQQPKVEPDNLKCKSVQKRLATLWGYVEAQPTAQCKHCTKFSSQYRCNASQGECDCPRCQGFCTCSQQPQLLTDELAACHKDAARYQWLVEYFVGDRTDLDDAIVGASEIGVEQVTAVIDAAMESK